MFGPGRTCEISSPSMKRSRSIQPCVSTACRTLAFCPPPNAVDEIVAKVSAILGSEGLCVSADIRHRPIDDGRGVLAGKDVNVDVLGVLIGRQNAQPNHEALL